ncbi:MAG: CBS domain-containing protein [Haloarculaceae archaeon]
MSMDADTPMVKEYMTRDVVTVEPADTVADVARRIADSEEHSGFPVCEGLRVEGFVSASDLLEGDDAAAIDEVMSEDLLVAHPDMDVDDAGRVILRSGIQKLPVVDDDGDLVGIISNADVLRSQIERATPEKVSKLVRTLEDIHDVAVSRDRREVPIADLTPTQGKVYADELEGRRYELERGLAEPLVVVDNGGDLLIADGHHRATAANAAGVERIDAYVIVIDSPVELGMAKSAENEGLASVEDIEIVDYARHPLVEKTHRLREDD